MGRRKIEVGDIVLVTRKPPGTKLNLPFNGRIGKVTEICLLNLKHFREDRLAVYSILLEGDTMPYWYYKKSFRRANPEDILRLKLCGINSKSEI